MTNFLQTQINQGFGEGGVFDLEWSWDWGDF